MQGKLDVEKMATLGYQDVELKGKSYFEIVEADIRNDAFIIGESVDRRMEPRNW